MNRQDIIAAKVARKSTLKSLKAKRESRIKSIQEKAAEEIRQVNIQFAADPERIKAKYAADAAYRSERSKRSAARAQKREEDRIAFEMDQKNEHRTFSFAEEVFNSITIGIGAGLAVAALVLYIIRVLEFAPKEILGRSLVLYSVTGTFLVLLYLMSMFSHALGSFTAKYVFRVLSYNFGFMTISSILSLFALVIIGGKIGWVLFSTSYLLGIFAVAFYSGMEGHKKGRKIGIKVYSILVFLQIVIEAILISSHISVLTGKLLIMAVITLLISEVFHVMKSVRWANSIFHLMAIIANIFGFFAIYFAI